MPAFMLHLQVVFRLSQKLTSSEFDLSGTLAHKTENGKNDLDFPFGNIMGWRRDSDLSLDGFGLANLVCFGSDTVLQTVTATGNN
jgi:hypothetical protein